VRDAAKILGIEELLDRKPKALSGGQRQRVAVGRAIVRQPAAFLFDEPLSNLDAKLRVEMRAELKRLHHRLGTTTIYVTHDQEEAMTLGDRIVVMKDGIIQQVGTPLEVYNTPNNLFVAGFVGTPPMNFIKGTIVAESEVMYFSCGGSRMRLLPAQAAMVSDSVGNDVTMGVRPEAMSLSAEGRFSGVENVLPVTVSVVEPLGEKMDLHASMGDTNVVARVDADPSMAQDQDVKLYLDMRKVHVFDTASGEILTVKREVEAATTV